MKQTLDETKNILLYQIFALTIYGKYKHITKNNKFRISARTWNEDFELSDGSYYVTNIRYYFKYILKNMRKSLIIF